MNLHFRSYGSGPPLIILHGLLGSLDNWATLARRWGQSFHVLSFDARNHGRSPHSATMTLEAMVEDLHGFMARQSIPTSPLLGHSMGGSTVMHFAVTYPALVDALVVVDIAPRPYGRSHDVIFNAISGLDLAEFSTRQDVENALAPAIPDIATRRFLLKNLSRSDSGELTWKMNLLVLRDRYAQLGGELAHEARCEKPALFVKGGRSEYLIESDRELIRRHFPKSEFLIIPGAGHWVHADAPDELFTAVVEFLSHV